MNDVSREYGSALYMVAREDDDVKTYMDGLNVVADAFLSEPEYMLFLSSPDVPLNQRVSSLEAVFGNAVPQKLVSFLQLLFDSDSLIDLMVSIEGKTLREVSQFVSEKLSAQDSVISTKTNFILKKYKDHGTVIAEQKKDERIEMMP